ncbi:glycosyltransferase family 8 protein, partial [Neobacillus vireti]|uniref:glycosyltransferase family 8 protein n=1 Tax=Neobacillus vireti TaxID=220686 RepID=UPI002FFD6A6D
DCDSIINDNLIELWNIDISDYYIAGVCDTVNDNTKLSVNMNSTSPYVNSGMLLINLKKWREEEIENKFLRFVNSFNGNVFHHDQGTINGVLNNNLLILHPKYNAMTPFFTMKRNDIMKYYGLREYYSSKELNESINNPIFIHFTPAFVSRPWIRGCKHPLMSIYRNYLDMTPWKETKPYKDRRNIVEKIIAFLYNQLPFKVAYGICNRIFMTND